MIVNNLYIGWAQRAIGPLKANSPLVVDADAVLALAVAGQCFEAIARQGGKVSKRRGCLQPVQPEATGPFKSAKRFDSPPGSEGLSSLVAVADNH